MQKTAKFSQKNLSFLKGEPRAALYLGRQQNEQSGLTFPGSQGWVGFHWLCILIGWSAIPIGCRGLP